MKRVAILLVAFAIALPATAATKKLFVNVDRVIVTGSDKFGGCLMAPLGGMNTSGTTCLGKFASLDCANVTGGEGTSKADGQRRLDVAMLARITGEKVALVINDAKKVNGYCVAERVDQVTPRN